MKIKPKENYELAGTYPKIVLDKNKVYDGVIATNQPNYRKKGLVFCGDILLNKSEVDVNESPIIQLVNQILLTAVKTDASDIHIDPTDIEFKIRYRVDGVLSTERVLPKVILSKLISRIKVMAHMDITDTRTPQDGRIKTQHGSPMRVSEIFAQVEGAAYVERTSMHDIAHIRKTKKAIKKAFTYQMENKGFTLIEVVSTCPVNWRMKPKEALDWSKEHMLPIFPLGVYKDVMKP